MLENRNEIIVPKGKVLIDLYNVITKKHDIQLVNNLITTLGKEALAETFISTVVLVSYCALGTDATAPDLGDSLLGSELARKQISVKSRENNTVTFQTFFTTAEAIGALKEAGLFGGNATGTADTGNLLAKTAIDRNKTANDTLTLTWSIAIG
jgi:hypothetical protein